MWKACRVQEKRIEGIMSDHRKRAERKAAYFANKFADPAKSLKIVGGAASTQVDTLQFRMLERGDNLMPWNERSQLKIDRFDVRALLDRIPPKPTKKELERLTSMEEEDEEEQDARDALNYERYHIIVENLVARKSERECLLEVSMEIEQEDKLRQGYHQQALPSTSTELAPTFGSQSTSSSASSSSSSSSANEMFAYDYGYEDRSSSEEEEEAEEVGEDKEEREKEGRGVHEEESSESVKPIDVKAIGKAFNISNYVDIHRKDQSSASSWDNTRDEHSHPLPRQDRRHWRSKEPPRRRGYGRRRSPSYADYVPSSGPNRGSLDRSSGGAYGNEQHKTGEKEYITEIAVEPVLKSSRVPVIPSAADDSPNVTRGAKAASTKTASSTAKQNTGASSEDAPSKKETPLERLKRRMRQKLNQQIAEDKAEERKKKEEKRKQKRLEDQQEQFNALKVQSSKKRSRSSQESDRSRSPKRSRDRSRSRNRSRSRDRSQRRSRRSRSRSRGRDRSRSRSRDRSRRQRRDRSRSRDRG